MNCVEEFYGENVSSMDIDLTDDLTTGGSNLHAEQAFRVLKDITDGHSNHPVLTDVIPKQSQDVLTFDDLSDLEKLIANTSSTCVWNDLDRVVKSTNHNVIHPPDRTNDDLYIPPDVYQNSFYQSYPVPFENFLLDSSVVTVPPTIDFLVPANEQDNHVSCRPPAPVDRIDIPLSIDCNDNVQSDHGEDSFQKDPDWTLSDNENETVNQESVPLTKATKRLLNRRQKKQDKPYNKKQPDRSTSSVSPSLSSPPSQSSESDYATSSSFSLKSSLDVSKLHPNNLTVPVTDDVFLDLEAMYNKLCSDYRSVFGSNPKLTTDDILADLKVLLGLISSVGKQIPDSVFTHNIHGFSYLMRLKYRCNGTSIATSSVTKQKRVKRSIDQSSMNDHLGCVVCKNNACNRMCTACWTLTTCNYCNKKYGCMNSICSMYGSASRTMPVSFKAPPKVYGQSNIKAGRPINNSDLDKLIDICLEDNESWLDFMCRNIKVDNIESMMTALGRVFDKGSKYNVAIERSVRKYVNSNVVDADKILRMVENFYLCDYFKWAKPTVRNTWDVKTLICCVCSESLVDTVQVCAEKFCAIKCMSCSEPNEPICAGINEDGSMKRPVFLGCSFFAGNIEITAQHRSNRGCDVS